jgi:hypothetical protein
VATVPSQADFMSADVKLYTTMVSIDDLNPKNEKLKPGMSAEVTILADESPREVLVIPIQSVVGNVAMGANRKCYVLDSGGEPRERDITVGMSNDKLVEVKSGLEEGDKVVLNPRSLLPEKTDMRPGTPGKARGADFEDGQKGGGKKGGGKGGPPGGGGGPPGGGPPGDGKFQQRSDVNPGNGQEPKMFKKS